MGEVDLVIGQRIRQRRQELGFSRHDLAETIGVAEEILEKVEGGERRAGGHLLSKIAPALGVTIAFFFEHG
ncbi:MAG TPA: helix-turn-helix transcriptional regulator [Acetobacteraceae bacterium]|nr:helix-turn-helix transcriptional regulator [Acetobacteraceae bacterium]